jgi:hypothetical protein
MSYFNRDMFLSKDKKNACTKRLARLCRENGSQLVELRNLELVRVTFLDKKDLHSTENPHFKAVTGMPHCWNLDGSSYSNPDYDIIAISLRED